MRQAPFLIATLAAFSSVATAGEPLVCASGAPLGSVELEVASPSRKATHTLPLRELARLEEGDTIYYRPILRPHEVRKGEVTLVLVPANKKAVRRDKVLIFDARAAAHAQQWVVPWRTSLVAFVYGPTGLNEKKVQAFLDRDDELVGELADYADKTAKSEALIAALSSPDSSREALGAALDGFSSKFGAATQLSRTAPVNQQATIAFQTLRPSIASYDPLAGQGTQSIGQTAGLATSVAEMFFGTPIGLAAGGTALLMNLRAIAFPKSEFRSAYSQSLPDDALGLCGKTGTPAVHTRVAYLWAARIPNSGEPKLTIGKANFLPMGTKSPLPLTGTAGDWSHLDRARNWMIQPDGGKPIPVKVQVIANTHSVELALGKEAIPGKYTLLADWDWDQFQVAGAFEVRPLSDFATAELSLATHDALVEHTGKVRSTLQNSDFEFVEKLELKKWNDKFAVPLPIPFALPEGIRTGPQNKIDLQVDTSALDAGRYRLTITQLDGKAHDVALSVLPPAPTIENLPWRWNAGVPQATITLKGKRLDLLRSLEISGGTARLGPCSAGGNQRTVELKLNGPLQPGAKLALSGAVAERNQPLQIDDAVEILNPRPSIEAIELSDIPPQSVPLERGELPAAVTVSAMIRAAHVPSSATVALECAGATEGGVNLRPGEQQRGAHLKRLSADQLFLTIDTSAWGNGCDLQAEIDSPIGDATPHRIARIVDIPSVEQFNLASGEGLPVEATMLGQNLETIAKAGWSVEDGSPVTTLPQPLSNSDTQVLKFRLPPPPAHGAALYVWLRGASKARITNIHAN